MMEREGKMKDLRPCPFCGRATAATSVRVDTVRWKHAIHCGNCGAYGPLADTKQTAALVWNKRSQ